MVPLVPTTKKLYEVVEEVVQEELEDLCLALGGLCRSMFLVIISWFVSSYKASRDYNSAVSSAGAEGYQLGTGGGQIP